MPHSLSQREGHHSSRVRKHAHGGASGERPDHSKEMTTFESKDVLAGGMYSGIACARMLVPRRPHAHVLYPSGFTGNGTSCKIRMKKLREPTPHSFLVLHVAVGRRGGVRAFNHRRGR